MISYDVYRWWIRRALRALDLLRRGAARASDPSIGY